MSEAVNIDEFVKAIHFSAVEVWNRAEDLNQQKSSAYFHHDGTPHKKTFMVPDDRSGVEPGSWRQLSVPLWSLVPTTDLRMKRLVIRFNAYAFGWNEEDPSSQPNLQILFGKPQGTHYVPVSVTIELDGISPQTSLDDVKVHITSRTPLEPDQPSDADKPLEPPKRIAKIGVTAETINVQWQNVPGATGYELQVMGAEDGQPLDPQPSITYGATTANISRKTLTHNKVYRVRARGLTDATTGPWSNTLYVSIPWWMRPKP